MNVIFINIYFFKKIFVKYGRRVNLLFQDKISESLDKILHQDFL